MNSRITILTLIAVSFFASFGIAQDFNQRADWLENWTDFDPNTTKYPEATETIPNAIANDLFLSNDKVYLLSGDVYVTSNANLTIEEGTIIRCDSKNPANLIVSKGSKLIAVGSESSPIIFTSDKPAKARKSGDWGGIIISGNGYVNTVTGGNSISGSLLPQFTMYGGTRLEEQTTVMRHVRIEFAGNAAKRKNIAGGLALLGLGSGSLVDHIMISYSGHDSFICHGGSYQLNNTVSFKAMDDDYQTSEGYRGSWNHMMAIRHPYISSPLGSYVIEIEGYHKKSGIANSNAMTDLTVSNATLINLSDKSNYMHTTAAISASQLASIYINSSKISGFSDIVTFDSSYTSTSLIKKKFNLDNSFFNIHGEGVQVAYKPAVNIMDVLKYNRFTQDFVAVDVLFTKPQHTIVPQFNLKKSKNTYMVMQ